MPDFSATLNIRDASGRQKHDFCGGTSPVEMYDYIHLHSARQQADALSTCDLGYRLL